MSTLEGWPAGLVSLWARTYTRGLPDEVAVRRRAELESDLWEQLHDTAQAHAGRAIVGRLLRGIPADVRWRYRTLLDQRGARQRSETMKTERTFDWWMALTAVLGLAALATGLWVALTRGDGEVPLRVLGSARGALTGGLVIGGLVVWRTHRVLGSWLTMVGAAAAVATDPILAPLAAAVVIAGLWTGRLQTSEAADEPVTLQHRQAGLTRRWYWWLLASAALFGIGLLFPYFVFDEPTGVETEDDGGLLGIVLWMTWWGSWLVALVAAGLGVILGGMHLLVRHRTHVA
jgi:hypothetical protein